LPLKTFQIEKKIWVKSKGGTKKAIGLARRLKSKRHNYVALGLFLIIFKVVQNGKNNRKKAGLPKVKKRVWQKDIKNHKYPIVALVCGFIDSCPKKKKQKRPFMG